jgi:hypothetical protein
LAGYFNWSYVNANRNGLDGTTRGPLTDLGPNDDPTGRYRKTRFGGLLVFSAISDGTKS